jgi:hypothetical protein
MVESTILSGSYRQADPRRRRLEEERRFFFLRVGRKKMTCHVYAKR